MIQRRYKNWVGRAATISVLILLGACQSLPSQRTDGFNAVRAIPGSVANERYTYLTQAIERLENALNQREANFQNIAFSANLYNNMSTSTTSDVQARIDAIRNLAESQIAKSGDYELVHADTHNGRIEFRSRTSDQHLSITVREPQGNDQNSGSAFVVTDMYTQVSLQELVEAGPLASIAHQSLSNYPIQLSALRRVAQVEPTDEASILSYFNGLPTLEREREDILRARALLTMRLGNNQAARPLVQRGIIRYPESPTFFVLAEHLFERASSADNTAPASLNTIMAYRFDRKSIAKSRQEITDSLNVDSKN